MQLFWKLIFFYDSIEMVEVIQLKYYPAHRCTKKIKELSPEKQLKVVVVNSCLLK